MIKVLLPLAVIGGGVFLVVNSAKASAKKDAASKAQAGTVLDDEEDAPPLPNATSRAVPDSPITQTLFTQWWSETSYGQAGVPGIWTHVDSPETGFEWVAGQFFGANPNMAIATNDGALWYWDNGWHPAPLLADDYDVWYQQGGALGVP